MAAPATKLPDDRKSVTNRTLDHEDGLYRHTKRPEWGVAILAWEKGGRRAYQFEDGRLRKFSEGYYSLMKPVDEVPGSEEVLVADLESAVAAHKGGKRPKPLEPVCSFEEQVAFFEELFPGGFQGDEWIAQHRRGSGRALKRHRDPIIERAQEILSRESCRQHIESDRQGHLVGSVLEMLSDTDLVALKQVKSLQGMEPEEKNRFIESLDYLLYGEDAFGPRFKRWVKIVGKMSGGRPSWRLTTALPALVFPDDHVCVRRSAFMRQAANIAPTAQYSRKPKRRSYRNFSRVARAVRQRLNSAGHEPRDLLDIHDFVWVTLRNAALKHIKGD
ncbi:MAG: hypothetical protein P8188_16480 [Gemmatimonadota bacterium]|jgi:hypothetical protein